MTGQSTHSTSTRPAKRPRRHAFGSDKDYRSSEDEDYKPAPRVSVDGKPSADNQTMDEENQTLAQRKATLISLQKKSQKAAQRLPQEVLRTIFRLATKEGAVPTAYVLASVCKGWREVIEAMDAEELYTQISFEHVRHRFSSVRVSKPSTGKKKGESTLSKLDKVLQLQSRKTWTTGLRTLSLAGCTAYSPAGLWAVANACPNLCFLDLSDCDRGMRADELGGVLQAFASRTSPLQPLLHLNLSRLRVLPQRSGMDSVVRQVLFAQCRISKGGPALQSLIIEDSPTLTLSPLRAICEASVEEAVPLLSSLTSLSLAYSVHFVPEDSINIPNLQFATPNLRVLDLDSVCHLYGWRASWTVTGNLLDIYATSNLEAEVEADGGGPSNELPAVPVQHSGWTFLKVARLGAEDLKERRSLHGGIADVMKACYQSAALQHLSVANSDAVDWSQLLSGLHPDCRLRKLCLARSGSLQPTHTRILATILRQETVREALSCLEDMDLSGNSFVNDEDVAALASCCPNLVRIALGGTAVTDKGISCLVSETMGTLKQLEIEACRGVTRAVRRVVASNGVLGAVKAGLL
jgi:hypothetical protein